MPLKIRKVLPSDRDDINAISRQLWDGHDYLPLVAEQWEKDPACHFYGVEVDGHIVAVGNLRVVENGRTGWMEGLRVNPEYRGRGFANEITQHLVKKATELGLGRLRYTTSDQNAASLRIAEVAGFSRLFQMSILWTETPGNVPTIECYPPIEETSPGIAYTMLKTNPSIVPHGILIYEWKALDNESQNFEEIGSKNWFYAAQRDRKLHSLSFGYLNRERDEKWWTSTIYAEDSKGFLSQLFYNLSTALKAGADRMAFTFESEFEKDLDKINLESKEQEIGHLVLLEKQLSDV